MEEREERVTHLEVLAETTVARLTLLEREVSAIKGDVAAIKASMEAFERYSATKADVAEAKVSIIMWVVSLFFLSQVLPGLLKLFGL